MNKKPAGSIVLVVGPVESYLPLAGLVDIEEERARLEKDLAEAESQIERFSPFSEKAPAEVVQNEREKLVTYQETAEKLRQQLDELK